MKNRMMFFNNISILIFIISVCLTSCGTLRMHSICDANFSRESYITIYPLEKGDKTNTEENLKFILLSNEWNYVPYDVITNSYKYYGQKVYAIDLSISYYNDPYFGWRYTSFSAEVEDINTKEVVSTANLNGDRGVCSVLKDFEERLRATLVQ